MLILFRKVQAQDSISKPEPINPENKQKGTLRELSITGKLTDKKTGETLPFASVAVYDENENRIGATQTDMDGNFLVNVQIVQFCQNLFP